VATADQTDEIRRQMAQIRRELHEDIQGVVAGAEAVTDWRRYIRLYPWASLGVAFAVGFLIIPRRRRSVAEVVKEVIPVQVQRAAEAPTPKEKEKRKAGIFGALFGMLVPIAVRAAQGYASQYLEHWIAQQGVIRPMPTPGRPGPQPGRPGMTNR